MPVNQQAEETRQLYAQDDRSSGSPSDRYVLKSEWHCNCLGYDTTMRTNYIGKIVFDFIKFQTLSNDCLLGPERGSGLGYVPFKFR